SKLKQYIENRLKFFKNLKAKNPKDEISRLERVLALQIQFWVISNIHDVSIYELISLDIPVRVKPLIENLYKREVTDEVRNLLTLYDQIHGLKKIVKFSMPGQTGSVEPAIKSRNVRAETEIK
ncbi:MAG: hypothetical protein K8R21_01155, partial [Leptospira sp.]|nr:hypothetical protein [Leptospira sp.]